MRLDIQKMAETLSPFVEESIRDLMEAGGDIKEFATCWLADWLELERAQLYLRPELAKLLRASLDDQLVIMEETYRIKFNKGGREAALRIIKLAAKIAIAAIVAGLSG